MIKKQIIVIAPTNYWNIHCDFEYQTAKLLSKNNKVFILLECNLYTIKNILFDKSRCQEFIHDIQSLTRNFSIFPSIALLPRQRFTFISALNKKLIHLLFQLYVKIYCQIIKQKPILWTFFPHQHIYINKFNEKLSIYDCVDYAGSLVSEEDRQKKIDEKKLIKKVDIVFTIGKGLYELKKNLHKKVFEVPQGCKLDLFKSKKSYQPNEMKRIPKPIIGFIGHIDQRLDYNLMNKLIIGRPEWSFVFIGETISNSTQFNILKFKKLLSFKNVYYLGAKNKNLVVNYSQQFDIAIIPYNIRQPFNLYCYPMKVFEYFCRGKPVVSTPIKSLTSLRPYVQIAKDAHEFSAKIKSVLKHGWPTSYIKKQRHLAKENSWEAKIGKISKILENNFPKDLMVKKQ